MATEHAKILLFEDAELKSTYSIDELTRTEDQDQVKEDDHEVREVNINGIKESISKKFWRASAWCANFCFETRTFYVIQAKYILLDVEMHFRVALTINNFNN